MKVFLICALLVLSACAQKPFKESSGHIKPVARTGNAEVNNDLSIPTPVLNNIILPPPMQQKPEELFTVVVHDLPVNELLFALARDAKMNVDIAPGITGNVSLNAIDQTLLQILERLKRQTGIRYQVLDDSLVISADTPYFVQYSIPYINMSRSSTNEVSISTQVASTGSGAGNDGGDGSSNSSTKVTSSSSYLFWETLLDNLRAILRNRDSIRDKEQKIGSEQEVGENQENSIIAHQETGIIAIKATEMQHAEIRKYIDNIVEHANRQVLVEATIVEVILNDDYQTGIDWTVLADKGKYSLTQEFAGLVKDTVTAATPVGLAIKGKDIIASVKLLDIFGNTRVLSSPKLMVLNNQTAVLKVVTNSVYFTTTVETDTTQGVVTQTIETQLHTVPIGLVMNVTPQISSNGMVIINARPSISRQVGSVDDPNPSLTNIKSKIPVIQVQEMESILKIHDGDIGVIGGLMQDTVENKTTGTPGLSRIPYFDNLFSHKSKTNKKTELVVFLRPRIIKTASIANDLRDFDQYLHNDPVEFKVPELK